MNWKEIIKSYPKAWEYFREYVFYTIGNFDISFPPSFNKDYINFWIVDRLGISREKVTVNIRVLFDFFDEQELNIEIGIDWNNLGYIYRIGCGTWVQSYSTRTEAEEQAFTKAFELLEEKLNRGK